MIDKCIFAKRGRYIRTDQSKLVVEVSIPFKFVESHDEDICVIRGIPTFFQVQSFNERRMTFLIRLNIRDVKPDVKHQHIAYYLYDT